MSAASPFTISLRVANGKQGMTDLDLYQCGALSYTSTEGFWCHAASTWDRGLWEDIIKDPVLLSKCTAKHAGRVALQLYATWVCNKHRPESAGGELRISAVWTGECLTSAGNT